MIYTLTVLNYTVIQQNQRASTNPYSVISRFLQFLDATKRSNMLIMQEREKKLYITFLGGCCANMTIC